MFSSDLSTPFAVNSSFASKKRKLRVNLVSSQFAGAQATAGAAAAADEAAAVIAATDADRRVHLQAVIVRVAKTRRTLTYVCLRDSVALFYTCTDRGQHRFQQLVAEAMTLTTRFTPAVAMVKSVIEDLIDKEYLARDAEDRATVHYVV